jgi:phenylacetate-CoA ligase
MATSIEDELYKFLSFYKQMPEWAKQIVAAPFRMIPRNKLLGKNYTIFYEEAKMLEYASKERIEEYQFLKLKNLLLHSYQTVPFYRNTWDKHGIDINKIKSFDDFYHSIPFLTRDMVQGNPESFLSNIFKSAQRISMNSGGSTGIPLKLYYLKGYTRAAEWAHMHLQWARIGYKAGSAFSNLRGDYIGKNRYYSYDPWRNLLILSSFYLNEKTADIYLELLNQYKVEYINAYPSSLFNLIQSSKYEKKTIPTLKGIFLGSENIFDWQIEKFKDFFEIDTVFYWYGHGELCALGGGCEASSNYHFFPSYSHVEFIETEQANGYSEKVLHEIVGTSFVNPLMPLIRYKSQDYGTVPINKCSCKREHKQLSKVVGREQEIAVGRNGEKITLTALIFGRHGDYFNHIKKMQIINTEPGKLIVNIIPKSTFLENHLQEIEKSLSEKQGMPFDTIISIVDKIDGTSMGKHRFLIRNFPLES